ncbi:MAG: MopE-related protein, partial [Candidatus Aenigmatarchaeota archaeon]
MRWVWASLLVLLVLAVPVQALSFIDTTADDFNNGTHNQTQTENGNVVLLNDTEDTYYASGDFISRVFDAGFAVNWTELEWDFNVGVETFLGMRLRVSDDASEWSAWSDPSVTTGTATIDAQYRYVQYRANLTTVDNTKTPTLHSVTLNYELLPPSASLTSPADGYTSTGNVTLNCSASSLNNLTNITLYWNYSGAWEPNGTVGVSGMSASASFFRDRLEDKAFIWSCLAQDETGQAGWAGNRTVNVSLPPGDTTPPDFTHQIEPRAVVIGEDVSITINATDESGIDQVWANITLPDGTSEVLGLVNEDAVNYTALLPGQYSIALYANDTEGNRGGAEDNFTASGLVYFNATVVDYNQTGRASSLTVYYPGTVTEVDSWSASDGLFQNKSVVEGEYDLLFKAYAGDMQVLLKGVNMSENLGRTLGMDIVGPAEGFGIVYGISNGYTINSTKITIAYNEADFVDENELSVHMCESWTFSGQECFGNWTEVSAVQDTAANTFDVHLTSLFLLGLGIKEEVVTECTEWDTRSCGTSDMGACTFGIQTCTEGAWGACVGAIEPTDEVCNGIDDDCDGVVDNIEGSILVEETKCQCTAGVSPLSETCNGIDDDCDGEIDEGCCTPGDTQSCGTDEGICEFGTQTCLADGSWGTCTGGIGPRAEICYNDIDEDCDGVADNPSVCSPMVTCYNGMQDLNEDGIDCGGPCDPCAELPWLWVGAGLVIVTLAALLYFFKFRKKGPTWEELERKYAGG